MIDPALFITSSSNTSVGVEELPFKELARRDTTALRDTDAVPDVCLSDQWKRPSWNDVVAEG